MQLRANFYPIVSLGSSSRAIWLSLELIQYEIKEMLALTTCGILRILQILLSVCELL